MIDGVSKHMYQRIVDRLDNGSIQFDFGSFENERNILTEIDGDIPNQPRKPMKQITDGSHPGLQDHVLQIGGDEV